MASHILIGPGKFGLGFAGDLFARVGRLDTLILSRSADQPRTSIDSIVRDERIKANQSYRIRYDGKNLSDVCGIKLFQCNFLGVPQSIVDEFTKEELKIITVSVPESGLVDAARLLARGITERLRVHPEKKLPLVLPFVNTVNNGRKLLSLLRESLGDSETDALRQNNGFLPDCVIDRICPSLEIDSSGTVIVDVESYASIIIKHSEHSDILRTFAAHWRNAYGHDVLKEVPDLEPWSVLKYWGLNGLHLLLASLARTPIYPKHDPNNSTDIALSDVADDLAVKSLVKGFAAEVSLAVRLKYPGTITRDEARSFLENAVQRINTTGDTVGRMLKSLQLDAAYIAQQINSTPITLGDPRTIETLSNAIVTSAIGEFLEKVDARLLSPMFHLSGTERVHPLNLAIGTSSVLYAIANHIRRNT